MDTLEYTIRTIIAENFCNRAIKLYEKNHGMQYVIDRLARDTLIRGFKKAFDRGLETPESLKKRKKEINQTDYGRDYIKKYFLKIIEDWTDSKESQENYTNMLMSLESLRQETLSSLKNNPPESEEHQIDIKTLERINILEPKFTLYTFDLIEYLQRKDNIIKTLNEQNKLPTDEDIKAAIIKEHLTPEDYLQNYRKGFDATMNYDQLLKSLKKTKDGYYKLIIDIHIPLRKILEENFIKADIEWLYQTSTD